MPMEKGDPNHPIPSLQSTHFFLVTYEILVFETRIYILWPSPQAHNPMGMYAVRDSLATFFCIFSRLVLVD